MKPYRCPVVLLLLMLLLISATHSAAGLTTADNKFLLIYSNNVHGEVEPCG